MSDSPATPSSPITLDLLNAIVADGDLAFEQRAELTATGGTIAPPTYDGGVFATEVRRIAGQDVPCCLVNSVQAEANVAETALAEADADGELQPPLPDLHLKLDNGVLITTLNAPHRYADGLFRDAMVETQDGDKRFLESEHGKAIFDAHVDLKPLFDRSPNSVIYGIWHSFGPVKDQKPFKGGVKLQRCVIGEIVAIGVACRQQDGKITTLGVKTSSRIDPSGIDMDIGGVFVTPDGYPTLNKDLAAKDKDGAAIFVGKDTDSKQGRPSIVGEGNITPSVEAGKGVITCDRIESVTAIDLVAIAAMKRRGLDAKRRAAAIALALCGSTLGHHRMSLRSRCLLVPKDTSITTWTLVHADGSRTVHTLDRKGAIALYAAAFSAIDGWKPRKITLKSGEFLRAIFDDAQPKHERPAETKPAKKNTRKGR